MDDGTERLCDVPSLSEEVAGTWALSHTNTVSLCFLCGVLCYCPNVWMLHNEVVCVCGCNLLFNVLCQCYVINVLTLLC